MQGVVGEASFEVLPGQVLVMDTRLELRSTVTEDVRLLRALVSDARLPHGVLPESPLPAAVLAESPIVHTCLAAANTLLQRCYEEGSEEDDAVVGQLVAGLQTSMLHEVLRQHPDEVARAAGPARRDRVEQYMALHLEDPDLSPVSIARGLGISLRSVHAAFDGTGTTVAASIRTQRIARLQKEVAAADETPSTRDLAIRYGFSDSAHLRRVFQAQTGETLQHWLSSRDLSKGSAGPV